MSSGFVHLNDGTVIGPISCDAAWQLYDELRHSTQEEVRILLYGEEGECLFEKSSIWS